MIYKTDKKLFSIISMDLVQYLYAVILCLSGGFLVTKNMQNIFNQFANNEPSSVEAESSLQFVITIYRHGVRSPGFPSYPSDPYKDRSKFFPDGDGALTKIGKQLMFNVGRAIRKRYSNFLRSNFSNEVHFVSTNMERTMMSAMLVSCGMFPPKGHQKWSRNIDWQPIPIWLDNSQSDKSLLWDDSTPCPRFKKDSNDLKSISQQPDKTPEHDFYGFITEHSGDLRNSKYDLFALWDIFECETLNGYKLPEWTKNIYPDKIKNIVIETFNLMVNGTSSLLKILSGPLYYRIYDLLRSKVDGDLTTGHKMFLHAGHDISVLAVLRGIGFKHSIIVKPGDSLFLELHYTSNMYHVKMFYLSLLTSGEVFLELSIPECPSPCSLSTFLTLANPLTPYQWEAVCSM